ncbi:MAG: hypothetical protein GIW95_01450 [Candidatus Eremiobacteraeota bacterium]|nr:hypothetical protein [Candidatus Eremiobacteraeota bacterium]
MHDRPTLGELLAAVRAYVLEEVAGVAQDRRTRFRALVAANVLAIAERELASAEGDAVAEDEALHALGYAGGGTGERRANLCAEIRAGKFDEAPRFAEAMRYAKAMVGRKLAVSNPRFRP